MGNFQDPAWAGIRRGVAHSQSCSTGQLLRTPLAGLCPDTRLCFSSLRVSPPPSCRQLGLFSRATGAEPRLPSGGWEQRGSALSVSRTGGSQFLNCPKSPSDPSQDCCSDAGQGSSKCPHEVKEKSHQVSAYQPWCVYPSSYGHLLGSHPHVSALLGKGYTRHLKPQTLCPTRGHEEAVP